MEGPRVYTEERLHSGCGQGPRSVAKARRLRRKARARDKGRIRLRARARLLWSRFSVSIRDLLCVFIGARA